MWLMLEILWYVFFSNDFPGFLLTAVIHELVCQLWGVYHEYFGEHLWRSDRSNLFLHPRSLKQIVILMKFSLFTAPEVVKMTTLSAASDENFIKMKLSCFSDKVQHQGFMSCLVMMWPCHLPRHQLAYLCSSLFWALHVLKSNLLFMMPLWTVTFKNCCLIFLSAIM